MTMEEGAAAHVFTGMLRSLGVAVDGTDMRITSVAGGFPSSQTFLEVKALEVGMAIENGADEIDIVLNVGKMLTGHYDEAASEVETIRAETDRDVVLKVIIESGALRTPELIRRASLLSMLAGADFVKTSTGFHPAGGASVHAVELMAATVGGLAPGAQIVPARLVLAGQGALDAGVHATGCEFAAGGVEGVGGGADLARVAFVGLQQFGHIGQPVVGIKANTGAAATQQHAVQFGRRTWVTAGAQQFGKSIVRGVLNGHGELGARRRNV